MRKAKQPQPQPAVQTQQVVSPDAFWRGSFGDEYHTRNRVKWQDRVPFWRRITELTFARTFLDIGTGCGWNMRALRTISADYQMSGVDINRKALEEAMDERFDCHEMPAHEVANFFGHGQADLVVTSGVLIHIPPHDLRKTMQAIVDVSAQFVLAIEYMADQEEAVTYREHEGKLWRRPFGRLYEELGMSVIESGKAEGFDSCDYVLLEKHA